MELHKARILEKRKVILYIACSLDGYIAQPNDDLSFLDRVQQEGEDYGYNEFITSVDTILIGRKTFDWVMDKVGKWHHKDMDTYVITRQDRPPVENVNFYTGDLRDLITAIRKKPGKNLFCDGGAQLVHTLLQGKLIDELIISVIPILVGDGIKLFSDGRPVQGLELVSSKSYDSGLVQLHYRMQAE